MPEHYKVAKFRVQVLHNNGKLCKLCCIQLSNLSSFALYNVLRILFLPVVSQIKGLEQDFTVTTLFIIFYSFYRCQREITCQSHYAIDVCTIWKTSMTSGREVSMQLLCWRAVLGSQRAALKWYKSIIIIIIINMFVATI